MNMAEVMYDSSHLFVTKDSIYRNRRKKVTLIVTDWDTD